MDNIIKVGRKNVDIKNITKKDLEDTRICSAFIKKAYSLSQTKSEAAAEYKKFTEHTKKIADIGDIWYDDAHELKMMVSSRESANLDADALLEALIKEYGENDREKIIKIFTDCTTVKQTKMASIKKAPRGE